MNDNMNDVLRERSNKMSNRKKNKKNKHIHEHYCSQNRKGRESHFNTKEQFNTHNDITKTSYDDTAGST